MLPDKHRPHLNSLRAIAAVSVFYSHFYSEASNAGSLGVRLFFVLSGFLITGILVRARDQAEGRSKLTSALRNFYFRRMLRLWPAYYLVLGVALVVNGQHIRHLALWHIFYLSNVLFTLRHDWVPWYTVHLWTLSIEEQFYLVWPIVVLFAPRRALIPIAMFMVLAACLFRMFAYHLDVDGGMVLTPVAFDALGAGALLAFAEWKELKVPRWFYWLAGAVGIGLIALSDRLNDNLAETLNIIPMAALVAGGNVGFRGPFGKIMDLRWLQYLGKISYGMYLYHIFLLAVLIEVGMWFGHYFGYGAERLILGSALSIAVAALSWRFVEAPANGLKRLFPIHSGALSPPEPLLATAATERAAG